MVCRSPYLTNKQTKTRERNTETDREQGTHTHTYTRAVHVKMYIVFVRADTKIIADDHQKEITEL